MGFDNECIINIQSLAGEYFCPVCRTLVYPNEALQSQCTHLYCKPCLTYVVGTTKACPYDGYLVTEADSKPLIESNKALAETIGKILVHCLFHRSGCTWQGPLSECTSHCSGCVFGNSPVVCNRCMIQIVHRQVQEHAQNCPGANPQVQQVTGSSKDAASSGAAASAKLSQTSTQPGAQTLQTQVSQTAAATPPAQDPNQQANAQAQAVAPAAVLTTEQWYQQQYQQYYQQYPGYDPYQQSYQQYYPYQQQSTQQLQQHPPHVQGQQQPQVYPQPLTQLQPQHPPHSQQPPLPQAQAQAQAQAQTQLQPQPHAQQQPQSHHQPQIPPQGQPQSLPYVQNQVNPQQQPNPGLQPHPQPQSQTQQPAHGHMPPQQQPYPQVQLHPQAQSVQPQLQPQLQAPQYQQSHPQGHQVQLQMQHSQPQLQHPVQQTQPQNHPQPNQPQSQQLAPHAVAGHHLYPPVQPHQQMQPGAPQQHPMHMHPLSGSIPQVQLHAQFPQQPLQMRPPQAHASLPNQQQPNLLQSQGQVLSVPPGQQNQIRPHPQQQVHLIHQRPVLQPMQQPLQPYGQQPPFPGQVSGLVQGPLHQQVPFVQQPMQSQSRPQGPPQSLQQSSLALPPPPHSGVLAQGMPPHQSQAYVGRPVASNHPAVTQPFPQSPGAFGVTTQPRPMQLGSGHPSGHQLYASRITNQQVSSEQQFAQSGLAINHTFVEGSVAERETGSPSQKTARKDASGVEVNSIGVKDLKSETGEKFADKEIISEGENNGANNVAQDETPDKGADTKANAVKDGIQKIVKEEGSNGNFDPSSGGKSVEIATLDGKDGTAADTELVDYSSADDLSSRQAEALVGQKTDAMNMSAQEKNLSQGQVTPQGSAADDFGGFQGKGFMHSSQLVAPSDQGRHQLPPIPYGPSSQQQRPVAPSILLSGPLPGPSSNALVPGQGPIQLRPHAPGHLPPPRQSLNPPDHLQQSGSFHDISFVGAPTPGLRGTGQFGHHPQGSFELQPSAPQGQYNHSHLPPSQAPRTSQGEPARGLALGAGPPGSFDPQGGVMGRAPPHGPEGRLPFNPVKTEMLQNQRPHHFDGRHPDFHGSGPLERGQFAHPSGNESNLPTMNGVPGPDSTSASGLLDERFKTANEERRNSFPSGPTRRLGQGEFEEVPKQFHTNPSNMGTEPSPKFGSSFSSSRAIDLPPHEYNYDTGLKMDRGGGAPSRFLPPYHTAGAFHPNDAGERQPQTGLHEDNRGREDFVRTQPDFLGSGPLFGRRQMDRLTTRSPGREYHGIPPRGFGGLSGGPLSQSALNDIDGRDTHPFGEGSRSFNLSSDPVGNSFRDGRFPVLPGQVRRGEFDGPGNFGMSEHFRNGDMMGQDFNHSSRGEFLGPRNVPSHMQVGDDFGAFSVSRMGELPGAGGFPVGEPFGGNKLNHPRLGEPGFRSSYSLHGFPTDGGFYAGNLDSFDRLRKRMPASTGWCRICKVDCETVEGLDLHSQTREHQKMTMDMVISIKQQNAKRQKTSKGHSSVEEGSRSKNAGIRGRGNKP